MPEEADNNRVDVGMAAVAANIRKDTASAYETRGLAGDASVSLADSAAVPKPHPDTMEVEVRDSKSGISAFVAACICQCVSPRPPALPL